MCTIEMFLYSYPANIWSPFSVSSSRAMVFVYEKFYRGNNMNVYCKFSRGETREYIITCPFIPLVPFYITSWRLTILASRNCYFPSHILSRADATVPLHIFFKFSFEFSATFHSHLYIYKYICIVINISAHLSQGSIVFFVDDNYCFLYYLVILSLWSVITSSFKSARINDREMT